MKGKTNKKYFVFHFSLELFIADEVEVRRLEQIIEGIEA